MEQQNEVIMLNTLKRFCSTDEDRHSLQQPFSQEEFSYATDGRVIVRMARLRDVPEVVDAPIAQNLWKNLGVNIAELKGWMEIPALPEIQYNLCEACFGSGMMRVCAKCEYCPDDADYQKCPDCGAVSFEKIPCSHECSNGRHQVAAGINIGNTRLNVIYLHKLNMLKGVMICPYMPSNADAVPFRFEGGDGLLMPMKMEAK